MRQIKFRGKTLDGKIVFGYYVPTCPMSSFPGIVDDMDYIHAIEPDSIAQLVGHDKDGNEVYEGDTVYLGGKEEYPLCVTPSTSRSIVARSTLKEAQGGLTMRQIKFRGISTKTGKFVYGYYVPQCPMSSFPGIVDDNEVIHEVKHDSIAQLVGHDKDGNEVYEGDTIYHGGKDYKFRVTISTSRSIVARSTLKEA